MSGRRQPVLVRRSGRRRRWIHRSAFRRRYRPLRRRCRPARRGQRRSVRSADGRCDRRLRDVARHGAPREGRRPRWRRRAVLARTSRAHRAGHGRRTIRRRSGDRHRPVRRTLHGAAAARSHSRRRALRASAVRRARLAQSPAARGRPVHVRDAGLRARRHDCRNGAVNFIDDRGRIFGGVNAVDAAAAAVLVAIVAFTYAGYRVFRLPPPPEVTAVTPTTMQEGPALRLRLTGNHFLPFMRVFIRRSDGSTLVHDPAVFKPVEEYTLVNTTLAPWAVESPSLAQVQLPDDLGPGVYDLMFFNETRQVAIHRAAFTIAPRPAPAPVAAPTATPLPLDAAQGRVRLVCRPAVPALIRVA